MRPRDLPGYSHVLSLLYPPYLLQAIPCSFWALACLAALPSPTASIWFLFVGPEVCPASDLLTTAIRLPSDSPSPGTPLPLANASRCRARSGLSPYRTCARRAHREKHPISEEIRCFWSCWADSNCRPHPYQYWEVSILYVFTVFFVHYFHYGKFFATFPVHKFHCFPGLFPKLFPKPFPKSDLKNILGTHQKPNFLLGFWKLEY